MNAAPARLGTRRRELMEKPPPVIDTARIALLSGLDEERVIVWQKHGLFDRVPATTEECVARAHVLNQLERANVPLEVLKAADQEDVLARAYVFEFLQVAREGSHPLRFVAERTGLDEQLLLRFCDALGIDDPSEFSDAELTYLEALAEAMQAGLPQAVALEICELWGAQMRFIAHAEVISYDANVVRDMASETASPLEAAVRLAPLTRALLRAADLIAQPLHRRHILQAIDLQPDNALANDLNEGLALGEVAVAISFVDLTGYTALTEAEGDRQALAYARRLERLAQAATRRRQVRIVKRLGDGFMLAGQNPEEVLLAMTEVVAEAAERDDMPTARAGIAFGRCFSRGGDYFGRVVNVASRVVDEAEPGEVLVTEEVVTALNGASPAFSFADPRERELRGMTDAVRLWRAEPLAASADAAPS
jgi:adenylate cyclase